ncbi:hypothetical protein [Leucobacter massiliensis]|uniref:Replicative helicase inhibitor G39P N-terminal domain-containing protein n=1 Tax=Leucobacter massiliensis TaxID=1686285 RepID=A0A2S9QQP0_9MICO|nr:hypothetical protein [Leucobacter massiliensis]PRI11906.1 hypothetical protein B4915_02180 [Leucobacter massiliensis]
MKKSEVAKLLAIVSAFDHRRVAAEHVEAWAAVIGHLPFGDAEEAVRRHLQTSHEWLMPVHVVEGVAALRRERAWEPPVLTPEERQLCAAAGVPAEEFVERRDEPGWVDHLRGKWLGIEQ